MKPTLHSPHNPRVKQAIRLRDASERRLQGKILIDGVRELRRALDGGIKLIEVYVDQAKLSSDAMDGLRELMPRIPQELLQPVMPAVMEKISYGQRQSEVVCVARAPSLEISRIKVEPAGCLLLVIDRIEKPGNLGAILRSADAAGASGVLLADPVCEVFNPNAIRASLGTIFTVPLASASSQSIMNFLTEHACKIYSARVEASKPYWEPNYLTPTCIVLGSEATGLGASWCDDRIEHINIPMRGCADSLNLSASVSILLYEVVRQRQATNTAR